MPAGLSAVVADTGRPRRRVADAADGADLIILSSGTIVDAKCPQERCLLVVKWRRAFEASSRLNRSEMGDEPAGRRICITIDVYTNPHSLPCSFVGKSRVTPLISGGDTAFPHPQEALGSGSTHGLNTGERTRS